MNLRMSADSLRLRLSPQDVELCEETKTLQESVNINVRSLQYCLVLKKDLEKPSVEFMNDKIEFAVPAQNFLTWLKSSEIEYDYVQKNLKILIEKDLKPKKSI